MDFGIPESPRAHPKCMQSEDYMTYQSTLQQTMIKFSSHSAYTTLTEHTLTGHREEQNVLTAIDISPNTRLAASMVPRLFQFLVCFCGPIRL